MVREGVKDWTGRADVGGLRWVEDALLDGRQVFLVFLVSKQLHSVRAIIKRRSSAPVWASVWNSRENLGIVEFCWELTTQETISGMQEPHFHAITTEPVH